MLRLSAAVLLLFLIAGPVRAEDSPETPRAQQAPAAEVLQKKVDLSVSELSLNEVLAALAKAAGANLVVDAADVSGQETTTILLQAVPLKDALDAILKPHGLVWEWEHTDSVIKITSPERAKGLLVAEVYAMPDLVATQQSSTGDIQVDPEALEQLAEFLKAAVEPQSWSEAGGPGAVAVSEQTASLIVRQTREIHDQLREVLDQMRRSSDLRVVAQLKVIRVPAGDLIRTNEQLLNPRTLSETEQSDWNGGQHRWSDATVLEWANVTLPDGEQFQMRGDSFKSCVTYRATVSENRATVLVEVTGAGDDDVAMTVSIPDGKLAFIPFCKGRIPVIENGQAFVVVIAPTIQVIEEEEELLSGGPHQ